MLRAILRRFALRNCRKVNSNNVEEHCIHWSEENKRVTASATRQSRSHCNFQHRETMMSGKRSTLQSAKKLPMFIETTCFNTLVEEVTLPASSAKNKKPLFVASCPNINVIPQPMVLRLCWQMNGCLRCTSNVFSLVKVTKTSESTNWGRCFAQHGNTNYKLLKLEGLSFPLGATVEILL